MNRSPLFSASPASLASPASTTFPASPASTTFPASPASLASTTFPASPASPASLASLASPASPASTASPASPASLASLASPASSASPAFLLYAIPLLLCLLFCTACGQKGEDLPPPDLRGIWIQDGWEKSDYYQFAMIDDAEILVYWFTPSDKSRDLHWAGTYIPPVNGKLPYKWDSQTRREEHRDANRFTLVDDTKAFLYETVKGRDKLAFDVMMSHMKMGLTMSRVESEAEFNELMDAGALPPRFRTLEDAADRQYGRTPQTPAAPPSQNAPSVQGVPSESREFSLTPGTPPDITIIPGSSPDAPPLTYTPPEAPPNQLP